MRAVSDNVREPLKRKTPLSSREKPILIARGISKSFPGVTALDKVDFEIFPHEVNALVGENGAGKSTLIKIMAGFYAPDEGQLLIDNVPLKANPASAHKAGVATIHQDHQLIPSMTVAENIMLGHWPSRFGIISKKEQATRAREALALVAPELSSTTLARRLSPAQGQLVEVARSLSEEARVLIMDEPTTSLSPREIDRLFSVVAELKSKGLGIVFVSHWLEEVFQIADRITVLRDSKLVGTAAASVLDKDKVIKMMVGRLVHEVRSSGKTSGGVVLEVEELSRYGVLENINLKVHAGEIVTLAGLVGAGRTEVANCIFGIDPYDTGKVLLNGEAVPANDPTAAIRAGIGYIPEDRRRQALISQLSVSTNTTLAVLDRVCGRWVISKERERKLMTEATRSLAIKMASPSSRVSTLSGGNQQKVVLARWIARNPSLLILDEPTKGVDVGAKAEISEIILRLASKGTAILLISSELPEVMALSNRVLVMRSGRISGELSRNLLSSELIMSYATTG
ncbi:MAG: sugar ABC transporter ATP-binding protein [Verrucomicrobia bacterium]|nr:sugar ABC transporter ATP-binding protein [Verrucomicrobiota bacterium]